MDTILECSATGIPAPAVQFYLGDTLLDSKFNERYSLQPPVTGITDISGGGDIVSLVTRQLRISSTLDEDSNSYSCVATNTNGNDSVEFELIVWGEHICYSESL